jgi:hypothetical protein
MPDTNYPYVDLNGVFNVQKDYLAKVTSESSDPSTTGIINDIQTKLTGMYNNYTAAGLSTDAVLDHQNKMMDIVNTEKQRLQNKKDSVDNVIYGQKRAVELNNSNRLKQHGYTGLLIILIITLVLFIGIMMLSSYLPFVPQVFFDLLSIIVISTGIYMSLYTFFDIESRSNMNFNELDLPGLSNTVAGNARAQGTGNWEDLLGGINGCMTDSCCGPDTQWDQGNNVCVPSSIFRNGFTTMSFAFNSGDLTNTNISSNSPYEFDNYVPVK